MILWWFRTFLWGFVPNFALCFILLTESFAATGQDETHRPVVVCAESVWCSIAHDIGRDLIATKSLISVPGLDPHHFQLAPSQARILEKADLLILTGAGYDQWAAGSSTSMILSAEHYALYHSGEDPHLFFDPKIVFAFAQDFFSWLCDKEPEKRLQIETQFREFTRSFDNLSAHIQNMRDHILKDPAGRKIAVLEPAGQRLLSALGLEIINQSWALDIMAGNGGTARDTAALEQAIEQGKIRFLVVNPLVRGGIPHHIEALARRHHLSFVEIGENLPPSFSWQDWMTHILSQISDSLSLPPSSQTTSP